MDNKKKIYFTSRLPKSLLDTIKTIARKEKRPFTSQIELIFEEWIKENESKYLEDEQKK